MHRLKCPINALVMLFVAHIARLVEDATLRRSGSFGRR